MALTKITDYGLDLSVVGNINSVAVGANVSISKTTIFVGNSTVNTVITGGSITLSGAAVIHVNSTTGINASALSTGTVPLARLDANVILTTSTTGINASALSVGTVPIARLPEVNSSASGIVNTAAQSISGAKEFLGGITANGIIITTGAGLTANGSLGTAGWVLTTNGTGPYWAAAAGGSVTMGDVLAIAIALG